VENLTSDSDSMPPISYKWTKFWQYSATDLFEWCKLVLCYCLGYAALILSRSESTCRTGLLVNWTAFNVTGPDRTYHASRFLFSL